MVNATTSRVATARVANEGTVLINVRARTRYIAVAVVAASALALPAPAGADTLPKKPFGPVIDAPSDYQGQTQCDPHVKPGVAAFKRLVIKTFPDTGAGYFTRSCAIGGTSEHKDGRAWDWMVNATSRSDRKKVDALIDWLLEKDKRGHKWARARRLGIMYFIWDQRIWSPWYGWNPYSGSSPHRDHVHFSFSWPGAKKQTSYWHDELTFVTGASANSDSPGFWSTTGNGSVLTAGSAGHEGDLGVVFNRGSIAGIAATPSGDGYWLVKKSGKVLPFGDARKRGSLRGGGRVADIVAAPSGYGYWIVTKSGRVGAFGSADHYGNERSDADITGIAPTLSGNGYWLASKAGLVFPYGDADELGGLKDSNATTVDIEASPVAGYWIVNKSGRVTPFGDAGFFEDARDRDISNPIVSIVDTPDGGGYWLVDAGGRARDYGNAANVQPHAAEVATQYPQTAIPADPAPTEATFINRFLLGREAN